MIRSLSRLARQNQAAPFVIEHNGTVVGQITVSGLSFGSLASGAIGYWISEEVAGKGITPTAVALVADWCFTGLGIHRVEICIRPENASSLRIVRKLGMRYEGLRRRYIHIDGDWRDHFCFAVTIDEVPGGLLTRLTRGTADESLADIPEADRKAARTSTR
jgi:ribosomal-protein-alanine N-acetyltransferase